jgi:hypothetical protein
MPLLLPSPLLVDLINTITPIFLTKLVDLINTIVPSLLQALLDIINAVTPSLSSSLSTPSHPHSCLLWLVDLIIAINPSLSSSTSTCQEQHGPHKGCMQAQCLDVDSFGVPVFSYTMKQNLGCEKDSQVLTDEMVIHKLQLFHNRFCKLEIS